MKNLVIKFCLVLLIQQIGICPLKSQSYINPIYQIRKDSAYFVDSAINYCNRKKALKVNIYKPIGDGNTERPVIIFIHGGGNVSLVDFNDVEMNLFAQEFAKRGYVSVSMEYREGAHLRQYAQGSPGLTVEGLLTLNDDNTTNNFRGAAHFFVSDSIEVIRGAYRAQQDVKAVIRMMKENHTTDSTSTCKVFLGGHSAGAIDIYSAIFLDNASEKPLGAGPQAAVTNPSWLGWGFDFFGTWVNTQVGGPYQKDNVVYRFYNPSPFDFNNPSCYTRPDLGEIDGVSHTGGGYDTKVMGAAVLAGALIDTSLFDQQISKPALFIYHIPSDLVVPFNTGKPFSFLNHNPVNGNPLFNVYPNQYWPVLYGSNWINNKLNSLSYPSAISFWPYNGGDVNLGTTHSILPGVAVVADSIAKFFSKVMDTASFCNMQVLPIGLNFTVSLNGSKAHLEWIDLNPSTTTQYYIEKSEDGIRFQPIAVIHGNGNRNYSYIDWAPFSPFCYYRILEKYPDGRIDYSIIRKVQINGLNTLEVYPNPAHNFVTIKVPDKMKRSGVRLIVYDLEGKTFYSKNINSNTVFENLNVSNLPKGVYLIQIKNEDLSCQTKLVIN